MEPPTKPPRTAKHPKESSGLLMTVIRKLSASESNEQREREKAKLEKDYKRSDQRLNELVSLHHNDLTDVMQVFAKLSATVSTSREKIRAVKENLQACKKMLHCRRDELKKLWLEGVEHKHKLQLLDEIEQLREVPVQLSMHLTNKNYLQATKLVVSALSLGDGSLEGVEALRELRSELQMKRQQLHLKLLEELNHHLYVQSAQEVLALRRQGSGRDLLNPFQRATELRASARGKAKRNLLEIAASPRVGLSPKSCQSANDDLKISEDIDLGDGELNSEHFIAVLIECLALLGKLPEATEALKVQMQSELLGVVSRTTRSLLDSNTFQASSGVVPSAINTSFTSTIMSNGDNKSNVTGAANNNQSCHPLQELLQTLLEQFRCIADSHGLILRWLARACDKHNAKNIRLYEISDVWCRVQAVMQLLLTDYLDIQNTSTDSQIPSTPFVEQTSDISYYFSRRKPQKPKKTPLFKFEHSSTALSISLTDDVSGMKFSSDGRAQREKVLVCSPDPHNITLIFAFITKFIEEIERATNCSAGTPCTLNAFLADYVKEVFLGRYQATLAANMEAVTKSPDAWKLFTTPDQMKDLHRSRPLLKSTVAVERYIQDLRQLMESLPAYSEEFLSMVLEILKNYRETCLAAYRSKLQPESQDKRIYSASYLEDGDINRLIRSLPNWANLQAKKLSHLQRQKRRLMRREETTEEESLEDVKQRNMKEAETLASTLGEGGVGASEILTDINQLRGLALLHESVEWFASSVQAFVGELPQATATSPTIRIPGEMSSTIPGRFITELTKLAQEFDSLADTCVLVLHVEVRVQCFHYLVPKIKDSNRLVGCGLDSQEPDTKVLELTRVLTNIDEALSVTLQPLKWKYVFEGLGYMIAKILMNSSQFIDTIDEGGIQKMCRNIFALQQTLSNITLTREVALDHARHYFELFFLTPEEILSGVVEKGPQFTELEYMNAFQLIHRSRGDSDHDAIKKYLTRLSDILGEVGVTV